MCATNKVFDHHLHYEQQWLAAINPQWFDQLWTMVVGKYITLLKISGKELYELCVLSFCDILRSNRKTHYWKGYLLEAIQWNWKRVKDGLGVWHKDLWIIYQPHKEAHTYRMVRWPKSLKNSHKDLLVKRQPVLLGPKNWPKCHFHSGENFQGFLLNLPNMIHLLKS
jgi:hypothetical protein